MAEQELVRAYRRTLSSGTVVEVSAHNRTNTDVGTAARKIPGRPPLAASGGTFPLGRSLPGIWVMPDVKKAVKAVKAQSKIRAATAKVQAQAAQDADHAKIRARIHVREEAKAQAKAIVAKKYPPKSVNKTGLSAHTRGVVGKLKTFSHGTPVREESNARGRVGRAALSVGLAIDRQDPGEGDAAGYRPDRDGSVQPSGPAVPGQAGDGVVPEGEVGPAVAALAEGLVKVESYKRRTKTGGEERVRTYVRRQKLSPEMRAKKGIFSGVGGTIPPKPPEAKPSGKRLTLYRGEGSHDQPSFYPATGPNARAGAWWTSSLKSAKQYAASSKGKVYQIDVAESEAKPSGPPGYYLIANPQVRERRQPYVEPEVGVPPVHPYQLQPKRQYLNMRPRDLPPDSPDDAVRAADFARQYGPLLRDAPIAVQINDPALQDLLGGGRIRAMSDLPDAGGKGKYYRNLREDYETNVMGVPADANPISGYLDIPGKSKAGVTYGDYKVVLKPGAKDHATITLGDSLNNDAHPMWMDDMLSADGIGERFLAASGTSRMFRIRSGDPWHYMGTEVGDNYVEAQIHVRDGIGLDDIAEIQLPKRLRVATPGSAKAIATVTMADRFRQRGITVRWSDGGDVTAESIQAEQDRFDARRGKTKVPEVGRSKARRAAPPAGDTSVQQAVKGANPHFAGFGQRIPDPHHIEGDAGYANNCINAVAAFELRMRGQDVSAKPVVDLDQQDTDTFLARWLKPDGEVLDWSDMTHTGSKKATEDLVKTWGDGARGWVIVQYRYSGGHIFVVVNDGGKVRFYDPQTGGTYSPEEWSSIEEDPDGGDIIYAQRMDDLQVTNPQEMVE